MAQKILFVCSGNTCRSPLAEVIARKLIAEIGVRDVEVGSAGSSARDGSAASDGALLIGIERGLDLSPHRSRALTRDLVAQADLILAMGQQHLVAVLNLGGVGKAYLLTAYAARSSAGEDIEDPFGADLQAYRATATELSREVRLAVERYAAERPQGTS